MPPLLNNSLRAKVLFLYLFGKLFIQLAIFGNLSWIVGVTGYRGWLRSQVPINQHQDRKWLQWKRVYFYELKDILSGLNQIIFQQRVFSYLFSLKVSQDNDQFQFLVSCTWKNSAQSLFPAVATSRDVIKSRLLPLLPRFDECQCSWPNCVLDSGWRISW